MRREKNCDDTVTRRRARVTCALSFLAILISTACLLVTLSTQMDGPQKETENPLCVSCAMLRQDPADLRTQHLKRTLYKYFEDDVEILCCAKTAAQMDVLMELVLQKVNSEHAVAQSYTPENFSYSHISAHKRLHPSVPYISKPDLVPQFPNNSKIRLKFDPENNDLRVEHVKNVEVMSTGLVVMYSGLYYVYSSIRFNPDSTKPCKDFDEQTWDHDVLRSRPNERQSSGVILSSLHTCCDDCLRDKETSYTGGAFYLQAGDILHVEVSGYALIRFDKFASYLGLYMLGGNM